MSNKLPSIGDLVRTAYSGPYQIVSIVFLPALEDAASVFVLRDYQSISLACGVGVTVQRTEARYWLNGLAWTGGDWTMDTGDIVEVLSSAPRLGQAGLFAAAAAPPWVPYAFQPGVDYAVGKLPRCGCPGLRITRALWKLWHCENCAWDFNVDPEPGSVARCVRCPHCKWSTDPLVYFSLDQ